MRPLSLHLENVGRFPELCLDFHDGATALSGPNGSGKSTILTSIEAALFADGSRDLAPMLGHHGDRLRIELTFEHAGPSYRVRRTYKGSGRGAATLDLELETEEGWLPLTRESMAETQAELERLLGLSRPTFNASAFLSQGNAAMFADARPVERKQLLGAILDPRGLWPSLCDRVRSEIRAHEADLAAIVAKVDERTEKISERPAVEERLRWAEGVAADAREALAHAEGVLADAQETLAMNAAALERVRALTAAHAAAVRERDRVEEEHRQATMAEVALTDAREEHALVAIAAARVQELERQAMQERIEVEAIREKQTVLQRAEERVASLRDEAQRLWEEKVSVGNARTALVERREALAQATDPVCDQCEQPVTDAGRAIVLSSLDREIADLDARIEQLTAQRAEIMAVHAAAVEAAQATDLPAMLPDVRTTEAKLDEARSAERQAAILAERIAQLERQAARVPELAAALLTAIQDAAEAETALNDARLEAKDAGDEGSLIRAVDVARVEVATRSRAVADAGAEVARQQLLLEQLQQAEQELADLVEQTRGIHERLDVAKLAERAFGRAGIPALLIENVIPQIEAETNRLLELMPTTDGVTLRVQLVTQREQRTVEMLKETLDVLVSDLDGERAYETFSGGERSRLNVCLRIALAVLLADRRGAESRLLALDEVEYLDTLGQQQLVDVVRSVAGRFDVVLVVSHHPNVRDAFDDVVEVVKVDGVSRVAASGVEVAA